MDVTVATSAPHRNGEPVDPLRGPFSAAALREAALAALGEEVVELGERWGLREVRVEPGVPGPQPILGLSVTAERDDAGPRQGAVRTQPARDRVAIDVRKPEVAQDDVRLQLERERDSGRTVVRDPSRRNERPWPAAVETSSHSS